MHSTQTPLSLRLGKVVRSRAGSVPWLAVALLAVGTCCQSGCGGRSKEEIPSTHEVTGTVVSADGTPLAGGMIEFRSKAGTPRSAIGMIQPDGTFSLSTMVGGKKLVGAVAGLHQVTVMLPPPATQDVQPVPEPVFLPAPLEVKPGGGNRFTIKLPPKAPGGSR